MRVTKNDLKGEIADFPLEVVERMVECQEEQGNHPNVIIFQNHKDTPSRKGGFDWKETREGVGPWSAAINYKNFKPLLSLLEMEESNNNQTLQLNGVELKPGDRVNYIAPEGSRHTRVFVAYVEGLPRPYIICTQDRWAEIQAGCNKQKNVIFADSNSVSPIREKVKLTKEQIAEKFGVDADLIEFE